MKLPLITRHKQQQGVALLSIMLILTLMTLIVAEVTFSYRNQLRKTTGRQQLEQARWYALSAEELAIRVLKQSFDDDDGVIHLGQYWAKEGMVFPVENGSISGEIRDSQGCFNVNAMNVADNTDGSTPLVVESFSYLLEQLGISASEAINISWATRDWVYNGENYTQYGDDHYMSRPVPHLAGKTAMRDISEWRAVAGVSRGVALRVLPYLCATPSSELKVNVNTIPADQPELLTALYKGDLPVDQARNMLEQRPVNGWDTVDEFLSSSLLANYNSSNVRSLLTVNSSYFELRANSEFAGTRTGLHSLLRRNDDNRLSVVRRKFGAFL
ncbi:type II secretion system minor pseudopilin GspK [Endozoicomonas gorgoniicola]|uniref:Type II secretion system protein K n=1 Tax=Endozoicomonas gorgoniicola TaxID=1234144 RepID=A0ABT3N2X4_9GAMM|nr:type II secretion system minor pseudopilin GspK [Endozoicomonas gorgoniicola]MCW7555976.1 type II secretion system minor pseudopilin GspK [Endozoicomonas gorgoniicola]